MKVPRVGLQQISYKKLHKTLTCTMAAHTWIPIAVLAITVTIGHRSSSTLTGQFIQIGSSHEICGGWQPFRIHSRLLILMVSNIIPAYRMVVSHCAAGRAP